MRKKIFIFIPLTFVLLISVLVFLHWHTNVVSGLIEELINLNTGDALEIKYSRLEGDLFRNIDIYDISVHLADGMYLKSNRLTVRYSLLATVSDRYHFESIVFDSLQLHVPADTLSKHHQIEDTSYTSLGAAIERSASQMEILFKTLPEISVGQFIVRAGIVQFENPQITIDSIYVELNASVDEQEIQLNIEEIYGRWLERNFNLQNLHAQLIGRADRITLNQLQIKTAFSHVYANSELSVDDDMRLILNLEDIFITHPDLIKLFNLQNLDSGYVHLSTVIIGSPADFAAQINMTGQYNAYQIDTLILDGDYIDGDIIIRDSRIRTLDSDLILRGRIARNDNDLRLWFTNFNIDHFIPDTFITDLSGFLRLKMDKLNFKDITGSGELMLFQSSIDSFYFDSLRFAIKAQNNNFEIIDPSFLLLGPQARFTVNGKLSRKKEIDLHLTTKNSSLPALSRSTGLDSMSGEFDGNLFLSGYVFDPNLEGYLWAPFFKQEGLGLDSVMAQIRLDNIMSGRSGSSYLYATKGFFGDFSFSELRVDLTTDSNNVYLDTLLLTQDENYFSLTGVVRYDTDALDVEIDFLRIFYGSYWIENDGQILLQSGPEQFLIERAVFLAPENGLIEMRGFWESSSDEMQFGIQLSNIQTKPFEQFLPEKFNISGILEGDFEIINPHRSPELSIVLNGNELVFNRVPIGAISAAFDYQDKRIYVSEFTLFDGASRINLDGDIALQLGSDDKKKVSFLEETSADLIISWEEFDLIKIVPALEMQRPLYGRTSGKLSIAGSLKDPRGSLEINAPRIVYDKLTVDNLDLFLHFTKDSLVLDNAYAELNGTSFSVQGWQQVNLDFTESLPDLGNQPLELTVNSQDDQMQFLGYFLDQVEQISGKYDAQLTFVGTPQQISLDNGYFLLEDGTLELSRVKNLIKNLEIEASIENSVLKFQTLSAYSAKDKDFWEKSYAVLQRLFRLFQGQTAAEGVMSGSGTIDFTDLVHPVLDLEIDMNEFYVDYFIENTQLSIRTRDLKIFGRDTIFVTGSIDLPFGDYTPDLDNLKKNIYLTSVSPTSKRAMAWNLDISIPGNFFISSSPLDLTNNFQLEIMGDLRSIQEPAAPNMELSGVMTILSGKYGSWGQDFQVESGTINFTTPRVINPNIDIQAERQSRGYIFELGISGNLDNQQLNLQVKDEQGQYLGISMFDKLTLLSLGTTSDRLSASDFASVGEDVINTSVETALSRGAESITGLDRVELNMEDRFVDLQSFKLNNGLKDASISFGKYLSSNLYLEYKSQFGGGMIPAPKLSWQPGNQIGLEYRINKSWSIDSYYSQTKRGNNLVQISLSWRTTF
jgi:hypothetical protein